MVSVTKMEIKMRSVSVVVKLGMLALLFVPRALFTNFSHRRADCPNPQEMNCNYCKKPGHMVRDCPDAGPKICGNCGEEGMSTLLG